MIYCSSYYSIIQKFLASRNRFMLDLISIRHTRKQLVLIEARAIVLS